MNKQRRKDIDSIIERLHEIKSTFEDVLTDVEGVRDEEQESYDNMPEGLQQTERGEIAQEAIDKLDEVYSALEDLDLDDLIGMLEEAQN